MTQNYNSTKIEALVSRVYRAGFDIHSELGPGLLESVYEALLEASLIAHGLIVERQKVIPIEFNGVALQEGFRADLLIEGELIVEIKSVERTAPVHAKQLLTYLRLTGLPLGLLMNFGGALFKDGVNRVINSRSSYMAPKP
jgi:GxxExxY protein